MNERIDQSGIADVDLLFMIDNSGSMATEQLKLARELPRLIGVLTTGDLYYGRDDDAPADATQPRYFTKVKTLHLGVVSSNLGGMDPETIPDNQLQAIKECANEGDEGKLQSSTEIALTTVKESRGGNSPEFPGYVKDEIVIEADPTCDLPSLPAYQDYAAGGPLTTDELARNFRCAARLGVRGCPFEQQLESVWRALAPSSRPSGSKLDEDQYKFLNDTVGQGDRYNKNFLREESILAVMLVTDEDDCSIKDAGKVMFALDEDAKKYGELNMRCGLNETSTQFLWPAKRYVDGLKSLRPDHPDRIIFGAVVGIPTDTGDRTIDQILDMPDMKFRGKVPDNKLPEPSCEAEDNSNPDNPKKSEAYPPRRILQVAKGFGDQAVIYSICNDDFAPALDKLIEKIAAKLRGNCLPRTLTRADDGKVNCDVYELLPENDDDACDAERGHLDKKPVERKVREDDKTKVRRACRMAQVPVITSGSELAPEPGAKGWYYDTFGEGLEKECPNSPQRISFQFGGEFGSSLPAGAGAVFECFQPVARVETSDVKGFDAVNTRCVDEESVCSEQRSNDEYKLICIDHKTCQIRCKDNPDCPPGWVCANGNGQSEGDDPFYCQLPTCSQDEAAGNVVSSSANDEET